MTNNNSFEDRLLAQLGDVIEHNPAPEAGRAHGALTRRRVAFGGGIGALAATGAALLVAGGGASSAYAVDAGSDGAVHVTIANLSDATGLQRALEAAGIKAVVDYTPAGKSCVQPRGKSSMVSGVVVAAAPHGADGAAAGAGVQVDGKVRVAAGSDPRNLTDLGEVPAGAIPASPVQVSLGPDGKAAFTISREQFKSDQTLVIENSKGSDVASTEATVVSGAVAPCELTDASSMQSPAG